MFQSKLAREGDEWTICYLARGESLPEDIIEYQGIVLTGSHYNCRDGGSLPWFEALCAVVRDAAEIGSPRVYGGCFGCQIVAQALNGEVGFNPSGRFLLMAEHIKVAPELSLPEDLSCLSPIVNKLRSDQGLYLLVSHGDCVRKIPQDSILLADSESCSTEIYVTGRKNNILACQSHPEFDYEPVIRDIIWPSITRSGLLNEEEKELYLATFITYTGEDATLMMNIISDFLHQPF
jgi:GMP synthase-like glutamine amidotransferase